jgi:prophage antirepressor-like protein
MNEMKDRKYGEFGEIEIIEVNGKPYFPATECAEILGYARPHNAIKRHCRHSLKWGVPHPQSPDKTIEKIFIPEGDLYRLIIRSKLPYAKAARFRWVVFNAALCSVRQRDSPRGVAMVP